MPMTRRRFLANATAGLAGVALGLPALSRRTWAVPASEKIVVAHIGVGGMGRGHVNWFAHHPDVETAAVCDVDSAKAEAALAQLREIHPDTKAVAETDFRRLLDRPDIDAITYATPDHWHALNAILAFQAGKHVYGEKPLSYDLAEGQAMLRACRRYGKVFQLGTQIHAGENYHRVVELLRAGVIGPVSEVHLWKGGGNPAPGFPADCDPPATLNWDMWLGPAPWRPYNPGICPFQFRYYWDFSAGVFGDFWCHIADLAFWALDPGAPRRVKATGDQPLGSMVTTPGFVEAEFEFAHLKMTWSSHVPDIPGVNGRDPGARFVGSRGELLAGYDWRIIRVGGADKEDIPEVPVSLPRSPGHQRNFLDAIRKGGTTESNLEYAVQMALPMHLASISCRLGRPLTWDADRQEFVGDDAANRMRHRPYRAPWVLPG